MAEGTRPGGGGHTIRTFQPDDTETEFYLNSDDYNWTLDEIIQQITRKWEGATLSDVSIEAKHIHTDCLGFDRYDPTDYTNFLCIKKIR